jgi:hypothetical protein
MSIISATRMADASIASRVSSVCSRPASSKAWLIYRARAQCAAPYGAKAVNVALESDLSGVEYLWTSEVSGDSGLIIPIKNLEIRVSAILPTISIGNGYT